PPGPGSSQPRYVQAGLPRWAGFEGVEGRLGVVGHGHRADEVAVELEQEGDRGAVANLALGSPDVLARAEHEHRIAAGVGGGDGVAPLEVVVALLRPGDRGPNPLVDAAAGPDLGERRERGGDQLRIARVDRGDGPRGLLGAL